MTDTEKLARIVRLWDAIRPLLLTGGWAGLTDGERLEIDLFIEAVDDAQEDEE